MYRLYRVLSYGAIPYALLRILYKGIKLPQYRERTFERFGVVKFEPLKRSIWVHAVSVGEVMATIPVIKGLQKYFSEIPIVVTTTTPTGSQLVKKSLKESVYHTYLPYDVPLFVKRFIQHIKPMAFIVTETELWPTIFFELNKKNIPIFLINGRISPTSFKNYLRVKKFISEVLNRCQYLLVQNEEYKERFSQLGAREERLIVTGNIKFDVPIDQDLVEKGLRLKQDAFPGKKVIVGASTHEGEEQILLDVFSELKKNIKDLMLLIVPRHPERFSSVYNQIKSLGFVVHKRSDSLSPSQKNIEVYLGDSMGEMMMYYSIGDIAFVGGSFAHIGGHNFLEPAALALPIISGPHVFNFHQIATMLVNEGGLKIAETKTELKELLFELLLCREKRENMAKAAKRVAEKNKGALQKTLDILISGLKNG